ncbi:UNVERIFIED_CONTAM: hypothetical protein FKN15_063965 [Acipenser sinensis]
MTVYGNEGGITITKGITNDMKETCGKVEESERSLENLLDEVNKLRKTVKEKKKLCMQTFDHGIDISEVLPLLLADKKENCESDTERQLEQSGSETEEDLLDPLKIQMAVSHSPTF